MHRDFAFADLDALQAGRVLLASSPGERRSNLIVHAAPSATIAASAVGVDKPLDSALTD
jgi:hypothetical protein